MSHLGLNLGQTGNAAPANGGAPVGNTQNPAGGSANPGPAGGGANPGPAGGGAAANPAANGGGAANPAANPANPAGQNPAGTGAGAAPVLTLPQAQAEIARLSTLLSNARNQPNAANPLVASPDEIAKAKAIANEEPKKVLPQLVPGFKASSLDVAVPVKVESAFKAYQYVPYIALSLSARIKAASDEENLILSSTGTFTVRGLDRRGEKSIGMVDWHAAANVAEERTRFHHGDERGDALAGHHRVVLEIARTHSSWDVAMEYDTQQRYLASIDHRHNLSGLDTTALTLITSRMAIQASQSAQGAPSSSGRSAGPAKRSFLADDSTGSPKKMVKAYCFRCGNSGHFPADCTATTTITNRPTAGVSKTGKSKNTLLTPDGKQFCFNFARHSSCNFGNTCHNFHGCSICGSAAHGAGSCSSAA
ncbi:hypothetical protein C8R46DRAFT_1300944 [Mycena filopes]|nr:hypothetical protein C8R46DRAFT_1300944 [Mycena filopes]